MKIVIIIMLILNILYSKSNYEMNELIKVDSCDKFGWCQKDGTFIKSFKLKKVSTNLYRAKEKVFAYQKENAFPNDIGRSDKFLNSLDPYDQKNVKFGYTKIDDVKKFVRIEKEEKEKIEKEKLLKEKLEKEKLEKEELEKQVVEARVTKETEKIEEEGKNLNSFLILSVGTTSLDVSTTHNLATLSMDEFVTDEDGLNYELSYGYYFTKNLFLVLSVNDVILEEATILTGLIEVNYSFDVFLKPYIGLGFGYSQFKWEKEPITVTGEKDYSSYSLAYSAQLGLEYAINDSWAIINQYQYISFPDHKTVLQPTGYDTTLEHKSAIRANLGLKYRF